MNDKKIQLTIFTPTYNRAHYLPRLYQSILNQPKVVDFEWLIVDDGSTDTTEEIVNSFIKEKKILIRYFKKQNGGKHTAINFGLPLANGALFCIVDSDDVLSENASAILWSKYNQIKDDPQICGIIGLSQYFEKNSIIGDYFLFDEWKVSFADVYLKYGLKGDKSVAFKTEILKEFPFPEEEGIRLVFEAVVWHKISGDYKVLAINQVIQKKEYLEAGLTGSSYKRWYIQSLAYSFYQSIKQNIHPFNIYPKAFINDHLHLLINSLLSGKNYFWKLSLKSKILCIILFPRAFVSYTRMKNKLED